VIPGPLGGHNWYPMSRDRATGFVFIPTQNTSYLYADPEEFVEQQVGWNLGIDATPRTPHNPEEEARALAMPPSSLLAWDPSRQQEAWRVDYPFFGNSGTLATAGNLVFQGSADGLFHAYHTESGEHLWSHDVGDAILGGPVTYELDGEQYILALAGQGGAIPLTMGLLSGNYPRQRNGRLIAFKLGAGSVLPDVVRNDPVPLDVTSAASAGDPVSGGVLYGAYCLVCHGPMALSAGPIPDLRFSGAILSESAFSAIVLDGILAERGMVSFAPDIGAEEVESIRAYLLRVAADAGR
jgi:quinohemoprotein ethanol dehydrogenase